MKALKSVLMLSLLVPGLCVALPLATAQPPVNGHADRRFLMEDGDPGIFDAAHATSAWQPALSTENESPALPNNAPRELLPETPDGWSAEGWSTGAVPPENWTYYESTPPLSYDDPTLGPSFRIFEPKARVYFDVGKEHVNKLDIFHDGSLVPSINFLELFWQRPWPGGPGFGHEDWRWGPSIGMGISSRAGDSVDGSVKASGAPVLIVSGGLLFEFPLTHPRMRRLRQTPGFTTAMEARLRELAPTAGVEVGFALGVSADESLVDNYDGSIFVGVSLHMGP